MSLGQQVTNNLFAQCVNLIASEANQQKLRTKIIDPLVNYFKHKLKIFYVIITIIICLLLISNIYMIIQFIQLKKSLSAISVISS